MSTWSYRVMRRQWCAAGDSYGIYEVYDGTSWTEDPCWPSGNTLAELQADYKTMAEAFKLPVLDHETGKPIKGKP
jgi:hypothetical protein